MGGIEYDSGFIRQNPIPAVCERCKRKEQIQAPTLENVRCFWCGPNRDSRLKPLDKAAYENRLANLWRHVSEPQLQFFWISGVSPPGQT
jgi:hypothetical protein